MSGQSMNTNQENQEKDLVIQLTDHLPVGIYRTTVEGRILYANSALARMLEYTLDEILNMSVYDFYFNRKERNAEIDMLADKDQNTTKQIIHLKTRNNKEIIVEDTVKVVKDKSNKVIYFDGILEDITEKKKAEDALKESQARYKILTDLTIEGIIIHDKGVVIDINPSAHKLTGYSLDFIKGKNVLEFIHPDLRNLAMENMSNKIPGPYELKLMRKNNTAFIAEVEAKDVFIDGKELRVVAFRDITDRKRIEEEILSLYTAVKQSPSSIVITDTNGIIEYVNPKFTEVTGYTFEEAVGQNPNILKSEHTESEDYRELWETIVKGETWRGEFLNKKKDGTLYWELASISPIIDEKGKTIKYLAVKEDITDRKNTESALIDSEKELSEANATKNVFFSIIAHDLKGPVGNISQLLKLLKDNFSDISNDEKLDYINILMGLSSKTNNLLDDLLLWARIQMNTLEFDIEKISLKDLTENTLFLLEEKAKEKNIKIISNVGDIELEINKSSIKTVIRNLLSNALKFSYQDSKIEINSNVIENNKFVEISVKDNGIGIPKEYIDKLFKIGSTFSTYGTDKEKGTGLGLILCKELIEKNGGSIRADSEEDKGSTFYFTIPLK